jgi:hypothetical protein
VASFFLRCRWSGPTMGAARGRPAVAACALCFGAGGGRRRSAGPGGAKGRMGRLTTGPIGPKVGGNSFRK